MSQRLGLLLSCFDFSPVAEDEFHDWYDTEHIPERERIPGFLRLERWISVDQPKGSVTTYDLSGIDVLRSAPYLAVGYENNSPWTRRVGWRCIKLARLEAEQIAPGDALPPQDAKAILVRVFNMDPALEPELTAWFSSSDRVPEALRARLFRRQGRISTARSITSMRSRRRLRSSGHGGDVSARGSATCFKRWRGGT